MKRLVLVGSLVLAAAALMSLAVAPRSEPEIAVVRDLVYGRGGERELKLDLAMPKEGDGSFPAIVFLHGKGWREGSRIDMNHFIEGVAHMGYVGVTVEYRLAPNARFPAQVEDCKAAVRWLRANAKTYRVRPERIGVVGFSAGGHLAYMLGVTRETDGLEGNGGNADQPSRVQAVVGFFAPTDFSTRDWPRDLEQEVIVPFLGGSFADKPDVYKKASPVSYVTNDAPPFLLFHGNADKLVPVDQSRRLATKLRSFGVPATIVELEGEGHGFSDANNQRSMKQMLDFLRERLQR